MQYQSLGQCFSASRLTLGGGGIGQVWGATDRDEALATVREAYAAGINCFDLAPMYGDGEAERVVGMAFSGGYPEDVHVTTKHLLGDAPADQVEQRLTQSLDATCERLNRDYVDIFILHGYVIADGWTESLRPKLLPQIAVSFSRFQHQVVPTFERLKQQGRIGAWGITAASTQQQNLAVLAQDQAPDVVQCITNVLDSSGSMAITDEPQTPRETIIAAKTRGIGVMGIRAVAAGALTERLDRKVREHSAENKDYIRAERFRALAQERGVSPSYLAHQYALAMAGVDTLVLGVKNRQELAQCVAAEAAPRLEDELIQAIDRSVL